MLRKNNPSKTGKVDAEKPEIVTYYFSIGNEWQRNYFICKGKLSTSPLRNKQHHLLLPESSATGVSRGILQSALLQKHHVIPGWAVGKQKGQHASPLGLEWEVEWSRRWG